MDKFGVYYFYVAILQYILLIFYGKTDSNRKNGCC